MKQKKDKAKKPRKDKDKEIKIQANFEFSEETKKYLEMLDRFENKKSTRKIVMRQSTVQG